MDERGLDKVAPTRRAILESLKHNGPRTIADFADLLSISYEGARQQVFQLERDGWIERCGETRHRGGGRPTGRYRLTRAGDHLFPKAYDVLTVEVIDSLVAHFGVEGLRSILSDMTDARVRQWQPVLEGLDLEARLEALRDIYMDGDPFMSVERDDEGYRLVERNCPFLNVASERPAICSLTVSTLQRLLGVRIVREERFQAGHGRCAFRVLADEAIDEDFVFEFEKLPAGEKGTPS